MLGPKNQCDPFCLAVRIGNVRVEHNLRQIRILKVGGGVLTAANLLDQSLCSIGTTRQLWTARWFE